MFFRILILSCLLSTASAAQPAYKNTSLDEMFKESMETTKGDGPGVSAISPRKVHFFAKYAATPISCGTGDLQLVFTVLGYQQVLKQIAVSHCIKLASANGRVTPAFVQDILVKGLEKDVKLDAQIEIYADLVGYGVADSLDQNTLILMVNRFEPVGPLNNDL